MNERHVYFCCVCHVGQVGEPGLVYTKGGYYPPPIGWWVWESGGDRQPHQACSVRCKEAWMNKPSNSAIFKHDMDREG